MLASLEKSILATIAYYDVLSMPLRAEEAHYCLIAPKRFGAKQDCSAGLYDVVNILFGHKKNNLAKHIAEKNGYYFLKGREGIVAERRDRQNISIFKWKKARFALRLLGFVPYVRMVLLGGSVAMDNAKDTSDIDVLIVAKNGRIWLCRLFVTLALSVLGMRRSDKGQLRHDLVANKICLNHYITDGSLHIPFHSMYNAQSYAHLIPVIEHEEGLFDAFQKANAWMAEYLCEFPKEKTHHKKTLRKRTSVDGLQKILERIIDAASGNYFERAAERMQRKRIAKNMPANLNRGRISCDDARLEFHPSSQEAFILDKYNKKMSELLQGNFIEEKDSGLSK